MKKDGKRLRKRVRQNESQKQRHGEAETEA